jgi:ubiquinone/menaquinone biosynthesis C-methylase UbiE
MNQLPADEIYYGRAATSYDKGRLGNPVTEEDDYAIANFLAECKVNSVIADVPAGTGRAAIKIISSGFHYKGADISPDMLEVCAQKIDQSENFDLVVADARNLPWPDNSCDYLISFKFLKWLPSDEVVQEVLTEFRRVCKGKALVNVKIKRAKAEISLREFNDRVRKALDKLRLGTSARSIERTKFEQMCKISGWKIDSVIENSASNGIVFNYIIS